ncbi:MAG: hypothetical protein M1833_003132 [Piccolia ochrophora]|nr:MAG: hypothetical protein M1833_003132 [Piccolia ochrophora]
MDILTRVDADLKHESAVDIEALQEFVDLEIEFGKDLGGRVAQVVAVLWPEIKASMEDVLFLSKGLRDAGIVLEYRLLRGFLAYGPTQRVDNVDAASLAQDVCRTSSTIMGPGPSEVRSRVSISAKEARILLNTVTKKLREIQQAGQALSQELISNNGDQVLDTRFPEVWKTYKNARDLDIAKVAFDQAVRYIAMALATKTSGIEDMVEQLAGFLERLELDE